MYNKLKKIFLILGDVFVLYASLYLSLFLRYGDEFSVDIWNNHYPTFSFIFIAWIFIFYFFGLYNLYFTQNNKQFFLSTFKSLGLSAFISVLFFYLNPSIGIAPKTNLFIYLLVFTSLFFFWRLVFNSLLNNYLPKNRLAYIGFNDETKEIINFINNNPAIGYVSVLLIDGEENFKKNELDGIKIFCNFKNLKKIFEQNSINTVILSSNPNNLKSLRQELFSSISLKLEFINSINFYENIMGRVPIISINQMWFLENLNESNKALFDRIKRCFDFCFALFILMVSLPTWIIIAIIIKIESRGSVFFKQVRLGKNGKEFEIIKFRTMRTENNNFSPTEKGDKRITRFGLFLRKSRLDEIPQVINILKGEMSFVGPRPERPELIEKLELVVPFYKERMLVNPGLTGWDQVSGEYHSPSEEDTLKKLQYDLFYVKNRSTYLDLSILLKTISVVFSRAGM
jgi:exopolysaccharide biosynthesis polyprenyl glycosylphosphotransferase